MRRVLAPWRRYRAAVLDRRLRSLQVTSNVWPYVTVHVEDDGVWGYTDDQKYARAKANNHTVLIADLVRMGLPDPVAAKLLSGCIPLSGTNNPDLAAVESVCRVALKNAGYDVSHIPVGLGLIHYFNAGAYSSLWGYVIMIHLGAVLSLDLMNSWLLMAESAAETDPQDRVWQSRVDQSLPYFAGQALGFAMLSAVEAKVVEPAARMGHVIAFVQRCFILLHEFGHAVLGHRTRDGAASQRQEHEADEFGVRVLFEHGPSMERVPAAAPGWAPPGVALGFLFAIRNAAEVAYPPPKQHSHPPAAVRWKRVLAVGSSYPGWGNVVMPGVLPPL